MALSLSFFRKRKKRRERGEKPGERDSPKKGGGREKKKKRGLLRTGEKKRGKETVKERLSLFGRGEGRGKIFKKETSRREEKKKDVSFPAGGKGGRVRGKAG